MIKIETPRLIVRTLSDTEIQKYHKPGTHNLYANGIKNKFGIFLKPDQENKAEEFVGSITDGSAVGANINIDEDQQKKGYGTEAFKAYCHYRFEVKKSKEVSELFVSEYSEKMAVGIGFKKFIDKKFQGLIDKDLWKESDVQTYKITKEQFYEKNSEFTETVEISEVPKSTFENILECLINILRTLFPCCFPKEKMDLIGTGKNAEQNI
jgi:hypothetical protein